MISVIIPIYNVQKYLAQCLESVAAQDYEDFEAICVDDCSTDDSVGIFSDLKLDERFSLVRHRENLGLPSARNTGLMQARGSHVFFLDSDDWISPFAFTILQSLVDTTGAEIAMGGVARYEEDTKRLNIPPNHRRVMDSPFDSKTVFERPVLFHSITSWNKLVSQEFIRQTGLIFKPVPRRFEDMLTYKWYLSGARVSATPELTYFYRARAQGNGVPSITQSKDPSMYADKFLAYADLFHFTQQAGYLNTEFNPLHSSNAMLNLPRRLPTLIEEAFSIGTYGNLSVSETDELLRVVLALKTLFSNFPDEYVENLPIKLKEHYRVFKSLAATDVLKELLESYNS